MITSKSRVLWAALAVVFASGAAAQTRIEEAYPRASMSRTLTLDFSNDGQHVTATEGERIELTLGMGAFRHYGVPEISSSAVRLESTVLNYPISPGGSRYTYIFQATAEGDAQIKLRIFDAYDNELKESGYSVTIHVERGMGHTAPQLGLKVDQENTEPWKGRWVNATSSPDKKFLPILRESFVPSMRKLTAVEVELIADQSNTPTAGDIEMWISNDSTKTIVADVRKTVSNSECDHVLFLFPEKGLRVSPGQVYTIQLIGADRVFGWKYVLGGYKRGAASAPYGSNPPLPNTRSTFLFKTYGTNRSKSY